MLVRLSQGRPLNYNQNVVLVRCHHKLELSGFDAQERKLVRRIEISDKMSSFGREHRDQG